MLSLTSAGLLYAAAALAIILPLVLVITWRRRPHGVLGAALRFVVVLLCQAVAVTAVGLAANNSFGFYNSWSDLVGGQGSTSQAASINGLIATNGSQGKIITLSVDQTGQVAAGTRRSLTVLAWLPPQYNQPQFANTRFPVTMMLPGQPGTPQSVIRQFDFIPAAMAAIADHSVKPFVAIFPPLMVAPPRDTECTDVPGGPQAETWLSHDVRRAAISKLRLSTNAGQWSVMGWSTGGFCAAKLLLRHPTLFRAAAGFGAYYDSETDKTTGDLFANSKRLRHENSPLWLITRHRKAVTHLLIIVSQADKSSYDGKFYADSRAMIAATTGMAGVTTILLPSGGHNYRVYRPTMPQALAWLGRTAQL